MRSTLTDAPVASFTTLPLRATQHTTGLMVKVAPLLPSRDLLSSQRQLTWTHTRGLAIGWHTEEQSATNHYQQQFRQKNVTQLLIVIFIFSISIGFGYGLDIINFQPIAKPSTLCAMLGRQRNLKEWIRNLPLTNQNGEAENRKE